MRQGYRASAWLVGFLVLLALGIAVAQMFYETMRSEAPRPTQVAQVDGGPTGIGSVPQLMRLAPNEKVDAGVPVAGVVLTPGGSPAAGATVSLYRMVTARPEWLKQQVDQAVTREDGTFQFRMPHRHGHLLGFEHPRFAGGLVEVSLIDEPTRLQLQAGYAIRGYVLNDLGAPVPNARVSLESVPRENRRARFTYTAADGGYAFENLAAGPARLVAHHESWQPEASAGLVIGDRDRADFRFARPAMSPLRGSVVDAVSQQPVAGASVELVPINRQLGFVDPISTRTAEDGTFLLSGLPRGSMRMLVRHPEHGSSLHTQAISAVTSDVAIELPPRTLVHGFLVNEEDQPAYEGGEVLQLEDSVGELAYTRVGADGSFRFAEPVSPGFASLRALGGGFTFRVTHESVVSIRLEEEQANALEVSVLPTSTVRGRFVDAAGEPVAGVRTVRTRLLSESFLYLSDAAWQLDVGAFGGGIMQLLNVDHDQVLAYSGADGTFEVRGFKPGPLLARASRRGSGSMWLRLTMPPLGEVVDAGDFVVTPGESISGRVLRGGTPFVGATVAVVSRACQSMAITDSNGTYHIDDLVPGRYSVSVRITGKPTGGKPRFVRVHPGEPVRDFDLDLEVGRIVTGKVRDEGGRPIEDALVSVRGEAGQVTSTDGEGGFRIELPRSAVELVVSLADRSLQKIVTVAEDEGELVVELDALPTGSAGGRVVGLPGRRPLPGVLLRVTPLANGRPVETKTRWVSTPDGNLRVRRVSSGLVRIEVWCDGYAPHIEERSILASEDNDLGEIRLEKGALLRGVVRDPNGQPVRDAMILLGEETDFDLFTPAVRSGADGLFEIAGVSSRSAQLVVRHPGFAVSTVDLDLPFDVLSKKPLAIGLTTGATIEVRVAGSLVDEDSVVYLLRRGHRVASAVLDERGRAWFANRSAGRYEVRLFGSDRSPESVDVAAGEARVTVRFDPAPR